MQLQPKRTYSLEEISLRKQQVLADIRRQQKEMLGLTKTMFAPLASTTQGIGLISRTVNVGSSLVDGVMMGVRIVRAARRFLSRFR